MNIHFYKMAVSIINASQWNGYYLLTEFQKRPAFQRKDYEATHALEMHQGRPCCRWPSMPS
jgi:hypothetical protein